MMSFSEDILRPLDKIPEIRRLDEAVVNRIAAGEIIQVHILQYLIVLNAEV